MAHLTRAARGPLLFAAGAATLLPVYCALAGMPGVLARALVGVVFVGTLFRPREGWLAVAALAPLGVLVARWLASPWPVTEPIILAFLAGWFLHEAAARKPWPRETASLVTPALLFAVTILASVAVQLAIRQISVDYWPGYGRLVFWFLTHDYFTRPGLLPIWAGAQWLEGVGLFVATVVLTSRDAKLSTRGLAVLVGAAAMMASINIGHFLRASTGGAGLVRALYAAITTNEARVSQAIADLNAAGSFFAMALCVAGGVAVAARRRAIAVAAFVLLVAGLWLAGSRTALLALALVSLAAALVSARNRGRGGPRLLVAAGVVLLILSTAQFGVTRLSRSVNLALGARVDLGAAALRIYADHPIFGSGVGTFYDISAQYLRPPWEKENAHNNFLQLLAELGIPGVAFFAWLLVTVASRVRSSAGRVGARVTGATVGLGAFLVTCFAGQPFLTLEVALTFWLLLGAAVGLVSQRAAEARTPPRTRAARLVPALLGLLVIVSIPVRAERALREADLSRAGLGLSVFRVDPSGERFRYMFRQARIYVPASGRMAALPFKLPGGVADMSASIDGRVVGRLLVSGDEWREMRLVLPRTGRRFVAVDLRLGALHQEPDEEGGRTADVPRVLVGTPRAVQ